MIKKAAAVLLALTIPFALAACTKSDIKQTNSAAEKKILKISYYNGTYGDEWIRDTAKAFEAKYPDIRVQLTGDPDMNGKINAAFNTGKNIPDIVMLSKSNWQFYAQRGYMADLSDIYNTKIDNAKTVKQKLKPDLLNYTVLGGKNYIIPWTDGVTGIAYNENLFAEKGWQIPKTMKDLDALLPQIKASNIAPFAWAGQKIDFWNQTVTEWWAQYEGIKSIKKYLAMGSPEVYKQQGRLKALEAFSGLTSELTNSVKNADKMDYSTAAEMFFNGKAAMIPCDASFEYSFKNKIPDSFRLMIMKLPALDGAKEPDLTLCSAGDFIFIPSSSLNIPEAKKFLVFMSGDDMLSLFTKKTGAPRPFEYDLTGLADIGTFSSSALDLWKNGKGLYMYSQNPVYYNHFSDWPYRGVPFMQIFYGATTPQKAVDDNYNYVKKNWSAVLKQN